MHEKVKVTVCLDRKVVQKLRELIAEKHKTFVKGLLSHEVEEALRYWVALHKNAQSSAVAEKFLGKTRVEVLLEASRVERAFHQVCTWLEAYRPGLITRAGEVPLTALRKAISEVRGSDPRTVKKWLKLFHEHGLIMPGSRVGWIRLMKTQSATA